MDLWNLVKILAEVGIKKLKKIKSIYIFFWSYMICRAQSEDADVARGPPVAHPWFRLSRRTLQDTRFAAPLNMHSPQKQSRFLAWVNKIKLMWLARHKPLERQHFFVIILTRTTHSPNLRVHSSLNIWTLVWNLCEAVSWRPACVEILSALGYLTSLISTTSTVALVAISPELARNIGVYAR